MICHEYVTHVYTYFHIYIGRTGGLFIWWFLSDPKTIKIYLGTYIANLGNYIGKFAFQKRLR